MTLREALLHTTETLQQAGVPDAKTDASLLLAHITGIPRMELSLAPNVPLSAAQQKHLSALTEERATRIPLQYLLGIQCFYGLDLVVDERALIPRPETELLCELAIAYVRGLPFPAPRVLDLCTGSGAIAITLAHECPTAAVTATDISEAALSLARENAVQNHVERIRFLQGDLFSPLEEANVQGERQSTQFHCILSNPPYIEAEACKTLQPEVLCEPVLALDGGTDGLDFYRSIAQQAYRYLSPGGLLALEIGDTQADAVCGLLSAESGAYRDISVHHDLAGLPRTVCAYAASQPT